MIKITPKLYLGGIGEFGDVNVLQANSIELPFLCQTNAGFPHTTLPGMAINLQVDGQSPDWFLRGLAIFFAAIYGLRIMSLHDQAGGTQLGAFLTICAAAQKTGLSYASQLAVIQALVPSSPGNPGINVPAGLDAQGRRLWP